MPNSSITVVIPARDEEGLIGEIVDAVQDGKVAAWGMDTALKGDKETQEEVHGMQTGAMAERD